ncbi:MAG: replicative DNA helicase [Ferruginibacter sp.]|nr:replicative DNA helicase [Cytophagales bacterium]
MEPNKEESYFKKSAAFLRGQPKLTPRMLDPGLGKIPPQALDLEEAVLGALMIEKDALTTVVDILKPFSFYKEAHQRIYNAILSLFKSSEPVDTLTVVTQLRKTGELEISGGAFYIAQLTDRVNSAANIEFHARIVAQMAIKREMISAASDILRDAYEDTTDVFQLLDRTEQTLFAISESNIRKNFERMGALIQQALVDLEKRALIKDGLTGVPTGFSSLDRVTSGWQKSDLVILAARPGMGKCLGVGTRVVMYDGSLKKVEDVVVGDQLMGDDSTPRKVLSIARGRENMYWVRQNRGLDYRVNESHILSLKRSRTEWKHKNGDVLNISVREYLQKADKFKSNYKGYKVAVEFDEQPLPIAPYFLGIWLGDGSAGNCRITTKDHEIVDYLREYAGQLELQLTEEVYENRCNAYGITRGRGKKFPEWHSASRNGGQPTASGQFPAFSLQNELREMELIENKHIPRNYLINSTEKRLMLLAGLIDSDGHYNVQSNGYEITQKNEQLARQIKFLGDTLGFRTSLKRKRASISRIGFESEVFRVRLYGDLDRIPVRLAYKKALPWKSPVDWRMTGIQVEFDREDDYYGFEIDGNRLFLLEDMTVTHNTAFVVSAMRNAAVDFQKGVAIFSLEMSSVQLVNRLISAEAELESEKIKKGSLLRHEWEQLHHKIAKLTEAPIFIDDTPALSILELRAKCRRLKSQHDIQLVVIDYLQLMTGDTSGKMGGNREQEIASISRALKNLAKELDVPVIALSQLSRAVETRGGDKRPQLSDLRESGSIEQDADMVIFLYRPEYYGITTDEAGNSIAGVGEVIIAKHRNGSLDTVQLRFIGKFTKFSDLDSSELHPLGHNAFTSSSTIPPEFNTPGTITLGSKVNNPTPFGQSPKDEEPPF